MTETSTQAFWSRISQTDGNRPFWIDETGQHSYDDLTNQITRYCGLFDLAGVEPGSIVAAITSDDWTACCLFLAALLDGAVPIILSPDAGEGRLAAILDHARPALVATDPKLARAIWAPGAAITGEREVALKAVDEDQHQASLAEAMAHATPRTPRGDRAETELGYLMYTSGTTSAPKGVMLSAHSLYAQLADVSRVLQVTERSRIGNGLVPYHTDGLTQGPLLAAWCGATLLRPARFAVAGIDRMLGFLSEHRVTHFIGAPTIYDMLCRFASDDAGFGSAIEVLLSSAAPLHPELWSRVEVRFGGSVVNEYGVTECVAASHFAGPLPGMGAAMTIGRPVGVEASLRTPDGISAPKGEPGELWLKGPAVFDGYFRNKAMTADRLKDGWLKTGDIATCDEAGDYRIVGRVNTAINSGGFLILPEEIDEALLTAPTVTDAKTIGIPHPAFGTVPVSLVVTDGPLDAAALTAHCRATLEPWKLPRSYVSAAEIPRVASGKADIEAVRALALQAGDDAPLGDDAPKALQIVEEVFHMPPGSATPQDTPDTIPGWDSFSHTALILELEDRLNIEIPPAEVQSIASLGDLLAVVARQATTRT